MLQRFDWLLALSGRSLFTTVDYGFVCVIVFFALFAAFLLERCDNPTAKVMITNPRVICLIIELRRAE